MPGAGAPPQRIGRYTLVRLLGKGGMAEVYLAKQDGPAGFQKTCVVKRIRKSLAEEPRFIEMFLREARVAARLNHPNAVQIFELGQDGKEYFLAMEFLDGVSLHRAARRSWHHGESVPMEVVLRAAADAALGLHHAHSLVGLDGRPTPLIHRDVSPDNVMLTRDGVSKVLDFGIAKSTDVEEVTGTGEVKGKIPFMSPEQLQGLTLDNRSDLWSLGVTMYWLLTGVRPFDATTEPMTIDGILRRDPKRPRELNPLIPQPLESIVMQLLEKEREKRVASGAELADKLLALLGPAAGYGSASTFAARAMSWADQDPQQPISALTILAARPESQWLKRLDDDSGGLERLFPESTPTGARRALLRPHPERAPSTGKTVTGLSAVERPSHLFPVAAGVVAAAALAIGAFFTLRALREPEEPSVVTAAPLPNGGANGATSGDAAGDTHADDAPAGAAPADAAPAGARADAAHVVAAASDGTAAHGADADADAHDGGARHEAQHVHHDSRIPVHATAPASVAWKLNGHHLGSGSGALRVPRGTARLTAVDTLTGGVTTVSINDGNADYGAVATGTLVVRAQPWAEVQIGRKRIGTTPLDPLTLKAGRYTVHMVHDNLQKNVVVDVKPGKRAFATADMRESP